MTLSHLPNKTTPEILGIKQKISKSAVFPDEFIFCDLYKGAWRCPEVSQKTPVKKLASLSTDIPLVEDERDMVPFSSQKDLSHHFTNSEQVGAPIAKTHFDFDSYRLGRHEKSILDAVAGSLIGKPILLLGFTDNVGTERYNDKLALKRAKAVKRYLSRSGLSSSEIHVEGNGVCCYLVPNGSEAKRRINRRVEIYIAK